MTPPSSEMIRIALLALITGVAMPLLIQLFLTVRALRRSTEAVERRLEQTLHDVGDLTVELRRMTSAPTSLVAAIASATPAVIAAVRTFRATMHEHAETPTAATDTATAAATATQKNGPLHEKETTP